MSSPYRPPIVSCTVLPSSPYDVPGPHVSLLRMILLFKNLIQFDPVNLSVDCDSVQGVNFQSRRKNGWSMVALPTSEHYLRTTHVEP